MAGDNVVTIDVTELPLPRLTQLKQELDSVRQRLVLLIFIKY